MVEAVGRALPRCHIVRADSPLAGVWQTGQELFDGVLISFSAGRNGDAGALRSLRELAPHARIVLVCAPADEPAARRAVQDGVDDYVLEPLTRDDVESAFQLPSRRLERIESATPSRPSVHEIKGLSDIMKSLSQGQEPTLKRLVELVRDAFEADGALAQIGELSASTGDMDQPVVEESVTRDGENVGRLVLGARKRGHYSAGEIARLADYTRLIDAVMRQVREREHWRHLAWTDDLSGLRNRRYFEKSLRELVRDGRSQRLRLTVFLLDIDDFKSYNDRFGHATGDGLIREIGKLLLRCSRERDIVARYGGDEFAVIFWDAEPPRVAGSQHPTDTLQLAERFCAAIRSHEFECLGPAAPGPVTISGGLASFPWDGKTADELMKSADDALIETKRRGKNGITLAGDTSMDACDDPLDASETGHDEDR